MTDETSAGPLRTMISQICSQDHLMTRPRAALLLIDMQKAAPSKIQGHVFAKVLRTPLNSRDYRIYTVDDISH